MKKISLFLFFIISSAGISELLSWDSTAAKYYPLAVGNVWSYGYQNLNQGCQSTQNYNIIKMIVSDTVLRNNKKYFEFNDGTLERIDSNSMNVYRYFSSINNEELIDSLLIHINDTLRDCRIGVYLWTDCIHLLYRVIDTNQVQFANLQWSSKNFQVQSYPAFYKLLKGIGLYSQFFCEVGGYYLYLNGCIINGVQYGNISEIVNHQSSLPFSFVLNQNYPNPFNPMTVIGFGIPFKSIVSLIVYDLLGQEISKLVDGELNSGAYKISWDATDFPSGVYYYKLIAGEYTASKKMILMK